MSLLVVDRVWKMFGELTVLADISFELARHEVICVIGASGSGKSTLLRCINLLEPIDAGRILLEETEISDPELGKEQDRIRRRIGIVFQAFNLFPHMSVLDNVTVGLRKVKKLSRAEADQRGRKALENVGLAHKADARPAQLSGGQQQRVAIARALAELRRLVLTDEPTGALDSKTAQDIMDLLRELNASRGITIVLVTHDPNVGAQAHRIVRMQDGEIVGEERTGETPRRSSQDELAEPISASV